MKRFRLIPGVALVLVGGLAGLSLVHAQVPADPVKEPAKEKAKAKTKAQPPRIPAGVKVDRNIEYAKVGDHALKLDIYHPEAEGDALPLVVWVHGGGWSGGTKDNCPAIPLSGKGYVVASVEYRLTGVAPFPAQIEDCRAALRWLRGNATAYRIDPKRVGVWGGSAGGHLVALLGTSADATGWDKVGNHSDQSARVNAVCDFYGPTDFLVETMPARSKSADSAVGKLLGGPVDERKEVARQASPLTYITPDDPPFLIVHGDQDKLVSIEQSERLEAALKKAGVEVTFLTVKNGGHGFGPGSDPDPIAIRERVIAFFDQHLKK